MQAQMNEALAKDQLVSDLVLRQSKVDAEQPRDSKPRSPNSSMASSEESMRARLAVQQSDLDQTRAILQLKKRQHDELKVRAGFSGMLQLVPVEVGQQVAPGSNLARVANPSIPEGRAQDRGDPSQGHPDRTARPDRHAQRSRRRSSHSNRSVRARTERAPLTFRCLSELPKGAVPDLSVDGTIELERLADVLYVGRPAFGQEQEHGRLVQGGSGRKRRHRVQVKLGRNSVNQVEVLSGLKVDDQVILSDMSAWDAFDRVRLNVKETAR